MSDQTAHEALRERLAEELGDLIHDLLLDYTSDREWVEKVSESIGRSLTKGPMSILPVVEQYAEAEKAAALARALTVLDEWGMSTTDGGFVGDEDFAEAIHDNGAWRLARDLRAALGDDREAGR